MTSGTTTSPSLSMPTRSRLLITTPKRQSSLKIRLSRNFKEKSSNFYLRSCRGPGRMQTIAKTLTCEHQACIFRTEKIGREGTIHVWIPKVFKNHGVYFGRH